VHVIGPGTPAVEVLVKVIGAPGQAVVELAVNETIGGGYTVTVIEWVLVSPPLVAVSVMV